MPITTKRGDKGKTSLCFGARVDKDDLRIEVCGTLDELCAFLGFSKSAVNNKEMKGVIEGIQQDLFVIAGEVAAKSRHSEKLRRKINDIRVKWLEGLINKYEGRIRTGGRCFYLSGESRSSASLDIARTVCRRAERRTVTFKRRGLLKNEYILIYLNRLSDLLYLMERSLEKKYTKVR